MKKTIIILMVMGFACAGLLWAQEETVVTAASEAAEGLDLQAVGELFAEAENLEAFENTLNDEATGVNNLDLDGNGEVDFIRVVEEAEGETHLIVLQAVLGEDDYQDVATIEVEKTGDNAYAMQVRGYEDFYGADYYVAPSVTSIHTWPIIIWMYKPARRPYISVYRWHHMPRWWVRRSPVTVHVYHTRIVRYHAKPRFVVTHTTRVRTVHQVHHKSRTSTHVVKTTVVKKPGSRTVKRTTVTKPPVRRPPARR